jgi:hypothetical protein
MCNASSRSVAWYGPVCAHGNVLDVLWRAHVRRCRPSACRKKRQSLIRQERFCLELCSINQGIASRFSPSHKYKQRPYN